MDHWTKAFAVLLLAAGTAGCASIFSGDRESVEVLSSPPGAAIFVDGIQRGSTPGEIRLIRKQPHTVTLKKEGYRDETIYTKKGFNWVSLVDAVWGPFAIFPAAYDLSTGAVYSVPEKLEVSLEEEGSGPRAPSQRILSGTGLGDKRQKLEELRQRGDISERDYQRVSNELKAKGS